MQSLQNEIDLLQNAYTFYTTKQSKNTGTTLRKCLMNVSKSVGLARKEVLESMKANVKPRQVKELVEHEPVFEVHHTDDGNLGDSEVVSDVSVEKPKKRVRKPKA